MIKAKSEYRIVFRADGNKNIGLGHIYRCLALVEILKSDFECSFFIQNPDNHLKKTIEAFGADVLSLPETYNIEKEAKELPLKGIEIVVLDGYHFTTSYQQIIKNKGCRLVCVDDLAEQHFVADVVINHNPVQGNYQYSLGLPTRLYQGVQYALIRPIFFAHRTNHEAVNFDSCFICFGGSDQPNLTIKAVKASLQAGINKITVVTGSGYVHLDELKMVSDDYPQIRHFHAVDQGEMASLINQSNFAICPSSTISYEVAMVGKPMITGFYTDNQRLNENFLINEKCAYGIGDFNSITVDSLAEAIQSLPEVAPMLVENQKLLFTDSSLNLKSIFHKLAISDSIVIRKATKDDMKLYFDWANDPEVRNNAITQDFIPWEDHEVWFINKLNDASSFMYLAEYGDQYVGQVRFEKNSNEYEIHYSLNKTFRGQGLADLVLANAIKELLKDNDGVTELKAVVAKSNIGSNKVFLRLGFKFYSDLTINHREFTEYRKTDSSKITKK